MPIKPNRRDYPLDIRAFNADEIAEGKAVRAELNFDHARARGASVVEACPVAPNSPIDRFLSFVPVFENAGFTKVARGQATLNDAVEAAGACRKVWLSTIRRVQATGGRPHMTVGVG